MKKLGKLIDFLSVSDATKACKFFASMMAIVIVSLSCGFLYWFHYTSLLYYAVLIISFIYLIAGGLKFNNTFVVFLLILGLNAFLIPKDPVFNSQTRYLLFLLLSCVCTPLIQNPRAIKFRECLLRYTLIGFVPLVIGSFIGFFFNVNMMIYNRDGLTSFQRANFLNYEINGGLFSGLFTHSMVLGPIAALVAVLLFVCYIRTNKKIWIILFAIASITVVMSASRAAVLGLVAAVSMIMILSIALTKKVKRIIGLLFCSLLIALPFADRAATGIINKQNARIEQNKGQLNSRNYKWQARFLEFKESPIFGIGFQTVDGRYDYYDHQNGQIEPSSSHLAVLSMTGIIGTIAYIFILYQAYRNTKGRKGYKAILLQGLFWAFFFHMWFEGYVFSAGSFICFLFWLVIGECFDYKYLQKYDKQIFKLQSSKGN